MPEVKTFLKAKPGVITLEGVFDPYLFSHWPLISAGKESERVLVSPDSEKFIQAATKKSDFLSLSAGDMITIRENGKTYAWLVLEVREPGFPYVDALDMATNTKIRLNITSKRIQRGRISRAEVPK